MLPGRDGETPPARPDALADFPEEFEQRPGGPPRDQARRAKRSGRASDAALARIEEMRRRVAELAREPDDGAPPRDRDR